jgi:hypothetical protein
MEALESTISGVLALQSLKVLEWTVQESLESQSLEVLES